MKITDRAYNKAKELIAKYESQKNKRLVSKSLRNHILPYNTIYLAREHAEYIITLHNFKKAYIYEDERGQFYVIFYSIPEVRPAHIITNPLYNKKS